MLSVFNVANEILTQFEGDGKYITPLKLQKLLYYCQAWHLVFTGKPLFFNRIEAWIHGPSIPDIYQHYKRFGFNDITALPKSFNGLSDPERQTIKLVCSSYGQKSAKYLEELTHSEYPWKKTRSGLSRKERSNRTIHLDLMKNYYEQLESKLKPQTISHMALRIDKVEGNPNKRKKITNVIFGAGSVMNILPSKKRGYRYLREDFSDTSDMEAVASDWELVGDCVQDAIDFVEEAQNSRDK